MTAIDKKQYNVKFRGPLIAIVGNTPYFGAGYKRIELILTQDHHYACIDYQFSEALSRDERIISIAKEIAKIERGSFVSKSYNEFWDDLGAYFVSFPADHGHISIGEPFTKFDAAELISNQHRICFHALTLFKSVCESVLSQNDN